MPCPPASKFRVFGSALLAPLPGMPLILFHGLNPNESLRFVWERCPLSQGRTDQQSQISSISIILAEFFYHVCMISLNVREKDKLELKRPLLTVWGKVSLFSKNSKCLLDLAHGIKHELKSELILGSQNSPHWNHKQDKKPESRSDNKQEHNLGFHSHVSLGLRAEIKSDGKVK